MGESDPTRCTRLLPLPLPLPSCLPPSLDRPFFLTGPQAAGTFDRHTAAWHHHHHPPPHFRLHLGFFDFILQACFLFLINIDIDIGIINIIVTAIITIVIIII
jgi:hypothetical protein